MKLTEFINDSVVTDQGVYLLHEGIEHIEALPLDKFIDAVENLEKFIATEKLDGANLIFGFDNKGKFYTSREAKGAAKKLYSVNDYEVNAANSGFASAHAALEKVSPELKKVVDNGEAVEVEILFGRQPNAIVYGSSYVAFLRMLPGESKKHPNQEKIKKLADVMNNKSVSVTTKHVATDDGVDIKAEDVKHTWKFTSVSYVESHHFSKVNVKKEIADFRKFLKEKNKIGDLGLTNMDIIGIKLPSVPKEVRQEVKAERERLAKIATEKFKLPIKEKFLDEVLRQLAPALRDVEVEAHEETGVEGVVLLNPKTLEQLKIVDKDVFTIINQFNFAIRNEIKSTARGRQKFENVSLGVKGDVFGDMLQRVAKAVGIPGLGEYISIKRTIKKFVGDDLKETMKNFTGEFKIKDVNKLKTKVVDGIEEGISDLEDGLKKYNKEWKSYTLKLKTGKEIKYTKEIHNRTLMVFAEVRKEMREMLSNVKKAKNVGDIAVAVYGKQLRSIH